MVGVGAMVQTLNLLAVLKMMSEAQQTCNQGLGKIVYEKIPNFQLQGFDDDLIRDGSPPFQALEKCQDLCIRDRTASNNLVRTCNSMDFQPGRLLTDLPSVQYEESVCTLSREQSRPEGLGSLVSQPGHFHFAEICLSASRIELECPKRKYIFERVPKKRFRPPSVKEVFVANRTECEDRCLSEFSFTCRSATYDTATRACYLSKDTRRTHPSLLTDDPGFEYLENMCLDSLRRCDGELMFLKELKPSLTGPFDAESLQEVTLEECQEHCLNAERYFCRSIVYDPNTRFCILSGEDSYTIMDRDPTGAPQIGGSYPYYELICMEQREGAKSIAPRSDEKQSRQDGDLPRKRDVLTAFQRYRNSRINLDYQTEITERTLAECLDECLRQTSYRCKSAMYSERFRICRLSRFDQKDGRLTFDQDYDYYESLSDGDPLFPAVITTTTRSDSITTSPPTLNTRRLPGPGPTRPSTVFGDPVYDVYSNNTLEGTVIPALLPDPDFRPPVTTRPVTLPPFIPAVIKPLGIPGISPLGSQGQNPYDDLFPGGSGNSLSPGFGGVNRIIQQDVEEKRTGTDRLDHDYESGDSISNGTFKLRHCINVKENVPKQGTSTADHLTTSSRLSYGSPGLDRDNCELSDRDSRELDVGNSANFETSSDFDFYERIGGNNREDCLEVSQTCNEDGMEFTLHTQEGFTGRVYTYGYYDRCFFRGNGGSVSSLRISGPRGYPDCGTQKYGDILTNIVVVQFSELVQTSKDKRYNLTCMLAGPGEAVVTSGYIGSGSGSPTPIEYLPAQNILDSRVRLVVMYQGRPTTTIAVGDPLTFRLETQQGLNLLTDIFATNVIAKDPYTGRSVQLIDRFGCPVDELIFPSLDRARSGDGLEARFNAFKIPESNFLVFEATVRSCRGGCQPVYCSSNGGRGSGSSFGRRKRETVLAKGRFTSLSAEKVKEEEEDVVMEMLRVYTNRDDIPFEASPLVQPADVHLTVTEYYGLISTLIILIILLLITAILSGILFRKYRTLQGKNNLASSTVPPIFGLPASGFFSGTFNRNRAPSARNFSMFFSRFATGYDPKHANESSTDQQIEEPVQNPIFGKRYDDPSEPVYTDPSLFERSRSLRSCSTNVKRVMKSEVEGTDNPSADFSEL